MNILIVKTFNLKSTELKINFELLENLEIRIVFFGGFCTFCLTTSCKMILRVLKFKQYTGQLTICSHKVAMQTPISCT